MARDTKRRRLDPDEVLADSVRPRPSVEELADLIQRVNPTGHDLTPAEEKRRYRVKAALQSLLLRRHPELVRVTSADGDLLEVALVGTGRHAAHVPIEELDEDMRAWARRALDAQDAGPPRAAVAARQTSRTSTEPLGAAREARERGAFDDARAELERALVTTVGRSQRVALVAELLDLLVVDLWDDAAALEVALRLRHDAEVLAHASVRAPLALAAARSGDAPRARTLLSRLTGGHAAAAWAALGLSAIAEKDRDGMRLALDGLLGVEANHPTVSELRTVLAALAAAETQAAEARLANDLASAASDVERESIALDHLRRWPKSNAALAVVARAEADRRAARLTAFLAQAAEATDDVDRLAALRSARTEGALGIDDQITELERGVGARRLAHARAELADLLRGEDVQRALAAWLAADERVREGATPSGIILRAAEIVASVARPTRETVPAAIACVRAEEHMLGGDHEAAMRAVAVGGRAAAEMADSVGLSRRLDEATSSVKRAADLAAIAAAESALGAGEEERAARLLGALAKGIGKSLAERIERVRQRRLDEAQFLVARAQRDLLSARVAAFGLLGRDDDDRWRREIDAIDEDVLAQFQLEAVDGPMSFADASNRMTQTVERVVSPDGRELALVSSQGDYIFVRVVDIAEGAVVRHALLRDPRPGHADYVTRVVFDGDRIRWGTASGDVFSIHAGLRRGLVVVPVSSIVPDKTVVEDVLPIAGSELAWLVLRSTRTHLQRATIVDLERCRIVREIEAAQEVGLAITKDGVRVTRLAPNGAALHEPNGRRAGGFRFDDDRIPLAAEVTGERMHLLYRQEQPGADELMLRWSVVGDQADDSRWCGLLGADPDGPMGVLAIDTTRSVVCFTTDDGWRLAGVDVPVGRTGNPSAEIEPLVQRWRTLDADDRGLEEERRALRAACLKSHGFDVRWEVPVGRDLMLATAARGGTAVAVAFSPEPRVVALTVEAAPDLGGGDDDDYPLWNAWRLGGRPELPGEDLERSMYKQSEHRLTGPWTQDQLIPGCALELAKKLRGRPGGTTTAGALLLESAERHPKSAAVLAELVEMSLRDEAFATARPWADRLLALDVPAAVAAWAERARGIAALRSGDLEAARSSWQRSLDEGDLDAVERAALRLGLDAYGGAGSSQLRRMLDAIEASDRRREAGDLTGAIAALDVAPVWVARDGHALARLADAWLEREAQNASERFARTRALAAMVGTDAERTLKYPPRKNIWPLVRIQEVKLRAEQALGTGAG